MAKLSDILPIYDITDSGCVIGDNSACLTYCFELSLPILFTMDGAVYEEMIEDFRKFMELVGSETIFHKQDFFYRKNYNHKVNSYDFIEQSYQRHFNEREFLSMKSYLYITKVPETSSISTIVKKSYAKTNEIDFLNTIENAAVILKKHDIVLKRINYDDLLSPEHSPFTRYFNFSDSAVDEIKDIDFSNGTLMVGHKKVKIYTIENLGQFPTEDVSYCKSENGLPVSNLFDFSYKLSVPHVLNTIIYVPKVDNIKSELDKKMSSLEGYNFRGSNKESMEELEVIQHKQGEFNVNYAYFHLNIMAYDSPEDEIDKRINLAFSGAEFKKKENILSRKDIFLGCFPNNALRIVQQRKLLMCLMLDLEACTLLNYEQNYSDEATSFDGVRLCDRVYGIPVLVDVFDEPYKRGWIKNKNAIVLAGSGGGKSFTVNHMVLSIYRQGGHFFCIDASFSYRLQCQMHGGVYLTYDEKNRISFNPFYLDWIDKPEAAIIFNQGVLDEEAEGDDVEVNSTNFYSNLLSDKINVLSGLLMSIVKNEGEIIKKFEETLMKRMVFEFYKTRRNQMEDTDLDNAKRIKENIAFDDFYEFISDWLPKVIKEKNLGKDFSFEEFLFNLESFKTGNELGYLLNSMDDKIKNIEKQRFVVIDVQRIRGNKILFGVVSILAMDLFNQKIATLGKEVKKVLCIDEAWQAISSPEMATFMKAQVKVIRKYGGQTLFISQELDDFIGSEIIKDSIINNSSVKIFADMGEFKQKFDPIRKVMAISNSNEVKIMSLNQNNREGVKYKEICICWEHRGEVYGVEVPTELKAIYETNAEDVAMIMKNLDADGIELTAINYANR